MKVFKSFFFKILLLCSISFDDLNCLNNGLASKPPMGWMSWERYTCTIDCLNYPDDCISEKLFKTMAKIMVREGYRDAGYEYINIDDCWPELHRDNVTLQLVPDKKRFPNGIKKLADYMHSKNLKLGIYSDIGYQTCAGYPGLVIKNSATDFIEVDAFTYADWGIDSLKVDGCYANSSNFDALYSRLGAALNMTGRPILYSCSWPAYIDMTLETPDYKKISQICNSWRNFDDIQDSWQSVTSILDFYAKYQTLFAKYQDSLSCLNDLNDLSNLAEHEWPELYFWFRKDKLSPGAWFDPDMLIIGNFGLSLEQSKAQFALWAILSAPLLMSNDLRTINQPYKDILLNKEIIAVNQDPMGLMGRRVYKKFKFEIWVKPITPVIEKLPSFAIVFFNRYELGPPRYFSQPIFQIVKGYNISKMYQTFDLFDIENPLGVYFWNDNLTLKVNPSGGVRMIKFIPV